jgi:glycosyltransferase involved in cell wall biosynthesis
LSKNTKKSNNIVLQVVPALDCGGVERGTVDIAKALSDKGQKSYIISKGGKLSSKFNDLDVSLIYRDVSTKNPIKMWKNISFIENLIKDNNINIVHARSRAPAWSAYFASKRTGTKFLTTFHGIYNMKSAAKKFYNSIMAKGDIVIAVSNFVKKHIIENYDIDEDRIRVIHRGVDLEYFDPSKIEADHLEKISEKYHMPKDVPIIVMPSRMTSWKGQEYLVKALTKIRDKDFYCVLVGDLSKHTNYAKKICDLIRENKMQSKIQIFGSESDIRALYARSDIVVSASIEPEAFGRTIVEAQAMKKLVLATNIGGAAETIIDNENGFHTIPQDENDMANKLSYLLSIIGSKEVDKIATSARSSVSEKFSLQKMQEDTLKVYEELTSV